MRVESSHRVGAGEQNIKWMVVLMVLLACGMAEACWNPPPPCGECEIRVNGVCQSTCSAASCETCINGVCQECNGDPYKACCHGSCCSITEHCCNDGHCCPSSKFCCGANCCNAGESCCDGKTCYDPYVKQCCGYGNGKTCNNDQTCCQDTCCERSCCDSWFACEYCQSGGCEPCLRKVSSYAELLECTRVPDPAWTPMPNGCSWSPEDPAGCGTTSFHNACDAHDTCYQTCGSNKGSCDNAFLNNLTAVCTGVPPGECRDDCIDWAAWYVYFVETFGDGAYEADQVAACACCDC